MKMPKAKLGDLVIVQIMHGDKIQETFQTYIIASWYEDNEWCYEGSSDAPVSGFYETEIKAVCDPRQQRVNEINGFNS